MAAPGWFGKLPMLGDFAHRRLPLSVVAACDAWLSQGVATSRAALGRDWLETYLSAPVWGFAWAPQVVDAQSWRGVLMPSVDAAGRYFPLLVMKSVHDSAVAADALKSWYEALADCALSTLSNQLTFATFEASLSLIDDPPATSAVAGHGALPRDSMQPASPPDPGAPPRRCSTWWMVVPRDDAPPRVWPELLPAECFAALLQGAL